VKTKVKQKNKNRIYYTLAAGQKREIYIGNHYDDSMRHEIRKVVRILVNAKRYGTPITVREWNCINNLPCAIRGILVREKLLELSAESETVTLGQLIEQFRPVLKKQKEKTQEHYQRTFQYFLEYYGEELLIEKVTSASAEKHLVWLVTERQRKLSETTVYRQLKSFRRVFRFAVKAKLIKDNPYDGLHFGKETNESRQFYVSRDMVEKVLASCPDDEFRLLVALSRYAGLRIPCEIREMKLSDFTERYFSIHESAKTGYRKVPLFVEIQPYFEKYVAQLPPDREYLFEHYRNHANLGMVLRRAVKAAGLKPWNKIFVNLRSSCITDKDRLNWSEETQNKVFGNSKIIRGKHYVQELRDEEFDRLRFCGSNENQKKNDSKMSRESDVNQKNGSIFNFPVETSPQKVSVDFPDIFTADASVVFYWAFSQLHPSAQAVFCREYGDAS
jgi:integrase